MILLTADPSLTHFGYAVVKHDDGVAPILLKAGCIKTQAYPKPKKGKPKAMLKSEWETLRLRTICTELRNTCLHFGVERVLWEDPAGSKDANAVRALAEIKGLCVGLFTGMGLPEEAIRALTVKKALTQDTYAEKADIAAVVKEFFPAIADSLNEFTTKLQKEAVYDALGVYCTWTISQG